MPDLKIMLLWYFVFLFSLVVHEASHAWAALRLGDSTAHDEGQVTLDPLPHIRREPLGMVLVPLVSFWYYGWMMGWASAPIDMRWMLNNPKKSALVSLAGPLANLGLVIISGILIRLGMALHFFVAPEVVTFTTLIDPAQFGLAYPLSLFLSIMFSLNVLLFVFNLLPLPPLDGSGILPILFSREEDAVKYLHFISQPMVSIMGMFLAWNVFGYVFGGVHVWFLRMLYVGI